MAKNSWGVRSVSLRLDQIEALDGMGRDYNFSEAVRQMLDDHIAKLDKRPAPVITDGHYDWFDGHDVKWWNCAACRKHIEPNSRAFELHKKHCEGS